LYGSASLKIFIQRHQHREEHSGVELKLFYAGFAIFLTCILYVGYYFVRNYLANAFPDKGFDQLARCILFIFGDLFDLNNAHLILFFSRDVRMKVLALLGCKKNVVTPSLMAIGGRISSCNVLPPIQRFAE
jgi:hypothetical protein